MKKTLNESSSVLSNRLIDLTQQFILSGTLICLVKLGIHKWLTDRPITIHNLAKKLDIHEAALFRFLRLLDAYDIVHLNIKSKSVKKTNITEHLEKIMSPHIIDGYQLMKGFSYTLKNNESCWEQVFEQPFYSYLKKNPHNWQQFSDWCAKTADDWLKPLLAICNFSSYKKIIDVGGGQGHLLATILQSYPNVSGILFEVPEVIEQAKACLHNKGFSNRLLFQAGNFLEFIPQDGDLYLVSRVLLNWDNQSAMRILSACRQAMTNPDAQLWIIDFVVPSKNHPFYKRSILKDIDVFTSFSSAIRTKQEWESLIKQAGLILNETIITPADFIPQPYLPIGIFKTSLKIQGDKNESEKT